jgi:hypothetical protein
VKRIGFREMRHRPLGKDGVPEPETITFEVTDADYLHLEALHEQIAKTPPGPVRTVRINELRTTLDIFAIFPGTELVGGDDGVTDALASAESLEAKGFVIPGTVRAALEVGQLRMDAPGALGLEQAPMPGTEQTGRFFGREATETERDAGLAVEAEDAGPLKPGSAAHSVLTIYGDRTRRTSYDASMAACGDYHARRRESTRLLTRGYLVKSGTLPNQSPGGRDHVDAYVITGAGIEELARLDEREAASA